MTRTIDQLEEIASLINPAHTAEDSKAGVRVVWDDVGFTYHRIGRGYDVISREEAVSLLAAEAYDRQGMPAPDLPPAKIWLVKARHEFNDPKFTYAVGDLENYGLFKRQTSARPPTFQWYGEDEATRYTYEEATTIRDKIRRAADLGGWAKEANVVRSSYAIVDHRPTPVMDEAALIYLERPGAGVLDAFKAGAQWQLSRMADAVIAALKETGK